MRAANNNLLSSQAAAVLAPSEPVVAKLADLIAANAPYDGSFALRIAGVYANRVSRANLGLVYTMHRSALCIIAQGAKRVLLGKAVYEYDPSAMLISAVDVPVASQITQASYSEPYLSFRLDLDPHRVAELALKVYPHGLPSVRENQAMFVAQADMGILNAAVRLVELMAQPGEAELIAPLVVDEILIRLLRSPIGGRVAQMGYADSSVHKIAKAVAWIRANFARPMNVEDLAESVQMSVSSFHQHFKTVTSMSPLQFQKALRLQEARRLMLSTTLDAGAASRRVGYLSTSQFSREYGRYFGSAPTKDIARLRGQDSAAVAF